MRIKDALNVKPGDFVVGNKNAGKDRVGKRFEVVDKLYYDGFNNFIEHGQDAVYKVVFVVRDEGCLSHFVTDIDPVVQRDAIETVDVAEVFEFKVGDIVTGTAGSPLNPGDVAEVTAVRPGEPYPYLVRPRYAHGKVYNGGEVPLRKDEIEPYAPRFSEGDRVKLVFEAGFASAGAVFTVVNVEENKLFRGGQSVTVIVDSADAFIASAFLVPHVDMDERNEAYSAAHGFKVGDLVTCSSLMYDLLNPLSEGDVAEVVEVHAPDGVTSYNYRLRLVYSARSGKLMDDPMNFDVYDFEIERYNPTFEVNDPVIVIGGPHPGLVGQQVIVSHVGFGNVVVSSGGVSRPMQPNELAKYAPEDGPEDGPVIAQSTIDAMDADDWDDWDEGYEELVSDKASDYNEHIPEWERRIMATVFPDAKVCDALTWSVKIQLTTETAIGGASVTFVHERMGSTPWRLPTGSTETETEATTDVA